ncbi:MAG: DRTGG domain-containing protein [Treponemataceae bacterium]|nr:MAG: DRTGG domain-containing protein [Treponemataceae bacterium]
MITISDIIETLPAHVVYSTENSHEIHIRAIVAGDLMSDVLVTLEPGCLLVTSLATEQSIRTADVVNAAAVLLVNDKLPAAGMKALAEECAIPLLATPLPLFEACIALNDIGKPVFPDIL